MQTTLGWNECKFTRMQTTLGWNECKFTRVQTTLGWNECKFTRVAIAPQLERMQVYTRCNRAVRIETPCARGLNKAK